MFRLRKLIEKNFKLLWKSRLFVVTTLIGPFIMAVLLGMAFNNADAYSITIGVHANTYGDIENNIIDKLAENFNVLRFNDEDSCVKFLKDYATNACIVLPKNIAAETNEVGAIIFYVDNSRINLVWLILDTLSDILDRSSSEISMDLTNDLLLTLDKAGANIVRLRNATAQAISKNNHSLEQVYQITAEMNSVDMVEVQDQLENFILRNKELETELNSFIEGVNEKIDESKDILSGIDADISELNKIEAKLDDIEDLASDSTNTLMVSELNGLLGELDESIFNIKETFSATLDKNNENKFLLASALGHLEQAQGLVQEMDDEINHLQVTNASKIVTPIITEIRPITSETTHFSFIYPTLIVLITFFISMFLSSSMIVMERKSRAFFRNYVSATSDVFFLAAFFVTDLIIVLGSLSIFVLFAKLFFDMPLNLPFFLVLSLMASLFILLGSFIGYMVKSEQSNILVVIIVSSTLVFFSNAIIPLESASQALTKVIRYNPLVISEVILRKLLIYKINFGLLLNEMFLLLTYSVVLILLLLLFLKFFYRNDFLMPSCLKGRKMFKLMSRLR